MSKIEKLRAEVKNIREQIPSEAHELAMKSLRLEKKDGVANIVFDQFEEKANKLSTSNMLRFLDLLAEVEDDKSLKVLVIRSAKSSIFIAGADISEIQMMAQGKVTAESLMKLQAVFTCLENLKIPSLAAIHGACLGGGLELALGCDYRICTDAPQTRIGLPEVQLGVIPGWGGTQRLPRLIGFENALDLILAGKHVDGKKAKKLGIVDKLCPVEWMQARVEEFVLQLKKAPKKRDYQTHELKEKFLQNIPGGTRIIAEIAKRKILEKTKGNYPAPIAALNVIAKTYGMPIEDGLKIEAEAFIKMVATAQSANLIHVFYLNEKVKRDRGTDAKVKPLSISQVGVVGAGVMGGGIAQLFAAKDFRVRMKDIHWDAITKGYGAAVKLFNKQVERRKMKPSDRDNAMAKIEGTTNYSGFKQNQLVVEAVVESMEVKKSIFKELEKVSSPDCVFASNTSSLSITEMASGLSDPSRLVGMHFFNPVDKMPLVEVIRGEKTSDLAVASVYQLSKTLGKTPIVVKDGAGFLVNRILGPYLNEAAYMMVEGLKPDYIDGVMEKFGMPMGPCALIDEVGLDVASKVAGVLYGAFGARMLAPKTFDQMVKMQRLGKKVGKGIYIHEGRDKRVDEKLLSDLGISQSSSKISDDDIVKRHVYVMVNEAARCLEEKVVVDVRDVDIGMIFGTGFAPFRGGLLKYADSVGLENIVGDLEIFSKQTKSARFDPAPFLVKLVNEKRKFYDIS